MKHDSWQEPMWADILVTRIRLEDKTVSTLRFYDAVSELAAVLSAEEYPSRVHIALALADGRAIETKDFQYQVETA